MPRAPRTNAGDVIYHALNRANARLPIFDSDGDYRAFLKILIAAQEEIPMRLIAYCLMPNHWHLVLWPRLDGDLSRFMQWLTVTHVHRWQVVHEVVGFGHLYQGHFKSFPVEDDRHYLTICRYVERNPLRAGLVRQAQEWPWSSLHQRIFAPIEGYPPLADGPLPLPDDWLNTVNSDQSGKEDESIRQCVARGRPFGGESWVTQVARQMRLESTLRTRGRPPGR